MMANLTRKYATLCNNPGKTDIVQPYTWLGIMPITDLNEDRYLQWIIQRSNFLKYYLHVSTCISFVEIIRIFITGVEHGSSDNFLTVKSNFVIGQRTRDTKAIRVPGCKEMVQMKNISIIKIEVLLLPIFVFIAAQKYK